MHRLISRHAPARQSTIPVLRAHKPMPNMPKAITKVATPITTPAIANPRLLDVEKRGPMPRPAPTALTKSWRNIIEPIRVSSASIPANKSQSKKVKEPRREMQNEAMPNGECPDLSMRKLFSYISHFNLWALEGLGN